MRRTGITSLIAALFLLAAARAEAAIAFVAAAHNTAASSPIACNVPAGTTNGNLMIWYYVDQSINSPSQSCPTGWNFLREDQSLSTNVQGIVCYRVASSEPASYTLTGGHAGEACGITTWSGAVGVGANNGSNDLGTAGTTLLAPGITTHWQQFDAAHQFRMERRHKSGAHHVLHERLQCNQQYERPKRGYRRKLCWPFELRDDHREYRCGNRRKRELDRRAD